MSHADADARPAGRRARTYLDFAATAPLRDAALEAYLEASRLGANPSSLHSGGRRARLSLDASRARLAAAAGADPSELVFTSSGTEADNLALKGLYWSRRAEDPARRRILVSGIEHPAVLDTVEWLEAHEGALVHLLPVDAEGTADVDAARRELDAHPGEFALATLMWANNEVGTVQPVRELVEACEPHGVPVHSDAVQAFGILPTPFAETGLASMAVSGHKLGAPVGIGALFVRRDAVLEPHTHGGGQERGIRSGTLNVAAAAAFAAVVPEGPQGRPDEAARLRTLQARLWAGVRESVSAAVLNGPDPLTAPERRLPGNLNLSFPGAEGDSLLFLLDMAGFETSTGSACTAGVPRPSHVVLAMSGDEERARGTQRFSLGIDTRPEDVDALLDVLPRIAEQAGAAGLAARPSGIETASTRGRGDAGRTDETARRTAGGSEDRG